MTSKTITVSTTDELYDALAKATGGETILLEGGDYGSFSLTQQADFDYTYPSTVTIASADPSDPAVFSSVDVRDAANLTFDGITFDYTYEAGDSISTKPFSFSGCDNLTIKNSTFDGDVASGTGRTADDGFATGMGLSVRGGTGTVIENNESFGFWKGMSVIESEDTVVSGNELYAMRMDGMVFSDVQGIVIEDNYIHDFRGSPTSGDHSDMIQIWTQGTDDPSTDIVIRDNLLDIGEGTFTQSIFMRNEVVDKGEASFEDMAYRNVLIENNTIINAQMWGINVGETIGLTITQNTVVHADGGNVDGADSSVEIPKINVSSSSTGVTITNNVTSSVGGWTNQPGWTVKNNAFVQDQDPNAPGYYADVFVGSSLQPGKDGSHNFVALPGGMIDVLGAGSEAIQGDDQGLQILFQVQEADEATRVFDASASSLDGKALPPGTVYTWDFGDGTTAKGQKVSHSYVDGGDYQVKLTITLPDGTKVTEGASVLVEGPEVLTMDSSGRFVAYEAGEPVLLEKSKTATGDGIQLGATGTSATVARGNVVDVVGADDMTIAFSLDADKAGSAGEVFRLHGSFSVAVTSKGELQVQIMRDGASTVTLVTSGAGLNSAVNKEKDIVISLDDGQLQVWVDGQLEGQTAVTGTVGGASGAFDSQNLVFGNPWNKANFNGDITDFEISVGANDYPDKPQTVVITTANSAAPDAPAAPMPPPAPEVPAPEVPAPDGPSSLREDLLELLRADDLPVDLHDRFLTILQEKLDVYAA